jgi:uncharacterized protein YxeA
MKNIFTIIVSFIFLLSCSEDDEKVYVDMNNTYLPLNLGNEWHYKSTNEIDSTIYISKITNYVKQGKNCYFEMTTDRHYKPGASNNETEKIYLRTSDGINYFSFVNGREYIYRIFKDISISEGTYRNEIQTSKILPDEFKVQTLAGTFSDICNIEVGETSFDVGIFKKYAKGIGLIETGWFRGQNTLIYARVNGYEYGERIYK